MCAKYFHGQMALQRKVPFLGLPVYNIVDDGEARNNNVEKKKNYAGNSFLGIYSVGFWRKVT